MSSGTASSFPPGAGKRDAERFRDALLKKYRPLDRDSYESQNLTVAEVAGEGTQSKQDGQSFRPSGKLAGQKLLSALPSVKNCATL